jgi:hypothetical protein
VQSKNLISYKTSLEAVDEAHQTPSGPAMRKILQLPYDDFRGIEVLTAGLSVAQRYRL